MQPVRALFERKERGQDRRYTCDRRSLSQSARLAFSMALRRNVDCQRVRLRRATVPANDDICAATAEKSAINVDACCVDANRSPARRLISRIRAYLLMIEAGFRRVPDLIKHQHIANLMLLTSPNAHGS
jgi:hypothetical protein